jgi:AbrB family looped-hinge helix DNA binding protein
MVLTTKVTTSGQITLPKLLRDQQNIKIGDVIEVVNLNEGVLLRPYINQNRTIDPNQQSDKRISEKSKKKILGDYTKRSQTKTKNNRVKDKLDPQKLYGAWAHNKKDAATIIKEIRQEWERDIW